MAAYNLPSASTSFLGRIDELSQIASLLRDPACRLLTLTGPGGIGKTRLAVEAARMMVNNAPEMFADGCCFVPLQPLTLQASLVPAIASALEFKFYGELSPKQQLLNYLETRHLLLVLDNFEHLIDGADLLPDLLAAAPHLKLLVTSRERLRLHEEWLFDVQGLSFPKGDQNSRWDSFPAVQLFLQCAHRFGYVSAAADTASIIRICQGAEGIPLAVELAAAWVPVMPCADIAREIEHSLDILATTIRNVPERHRSMRAAFEHSWGLLTTKEQAVFRQLSVFRGGFTREAAEQVAGATLAILASLVDKSMVELDPGGRYDLHELLRQYAADKLTEAGEAHATAQCHGDYFLGLAEGAEAHVFGREQIAWFDRLEVEFDNLRAALLWLLQNGNAETGLRLAAALGWFFSERAHWNEGLDWLERMLSASPDAPAFLRAKALHSAGALAGWLEDDQRTRTLCGQALTLARAANDRWNIAWSLSHLGNYIQGDPDRSAALLEESLALFRELGDAMGITHTLVRRAWKAIQVQQDYIYGRALLEEGMIGASEVGDKVITAWVQYMLGLISWLHDRDLRQAKSYFESCALLLREARGLSYNVLILLADVEQVMGNAARAQQLYEESLISLQGTIPDHTYLSWVLAGLVSTARSLEQFERAAQLLGAANSLALDEKRNSHDIAHFDLGRVAVAAVRAQLGETVFAEAWAAGNAMTPAQIIAYLLEDRATPIEMSVTERNGSAEKAQADGHSGSEPLNARELDVLALVADGLSNREIAGRLFVSVNTVKWYLKTIFARLEVGSRTEAVTRAQAQGLLHQS